MQPATALDALRILLQPGAVPPSLVDRLAELWQYIALGGSSILTEELAPLLGGVAAHEGQLGLVRVIVACTVGSWAGMFVFYLLGRWRGRWAARRWPRFGAHLRRILGVVRRRPWRSSIATRFALGARWVLPAACGAAHVPVWKYLAGSAISSVIWAVPFTLLGWAFGGAAVGMVAQLKEYGTVVMLVLAAVLVAVLLVRRYRRRAARPPVTADGGLG